jgi:CheY-like chemotaxis protein
LIVEDDALIAFDGQDILQDFGVPFVEIAATIESALRVLAEKPVHAAFLDLRLGEETSSVIADALGDKNIPFCFATGSSAQQDVPARHASASVLQKPYTAEQLTGALLKMTIGT